MESNKTKVAAQTEGTAGAAKADAEGKSRAAETGTGSAAAKPGAAGASTAKPSASRPGTAGSGAAKLGIAGSGTAKADAARQVRTMEELIECARRRGPKRTAVVAPYDEASIMAVKEGLEGGLLIPELFGDEALIRGAMEEFGLDAAEIRICHQADTASAIRAAVDSVRRDENVLLMKGKVTTPALLRVVVDKKEGLNAGRLCSYIAICEIPGIDRLILSTDGGLNIAPTLKEKVDIVKNAVDAARSLGIEQPRVAVMAAVEDVNPAMQATVDAACLSKMADRGVFGSALVDGPLAFDNIISEKAAKKKGIRSQVAGRADIILSHTIEVGNALGKCMTYIGGSINAGIVVGAKVPIITPSRAGERKVKLASLAAGVLLERRD